MSAILWLIERDEDLIGWDETEGFVIRAESEEQARRLAKRRSWDRSKDWLDPKKARCRQIIGPGRVGVVLQANRRG